jgi:hypothetical protein
VCWHDGGEVGNATGVPSCRRAKGGRGGGVPPRRTAVEGGGGDIELRVRGYRPLPMIEGGRGSSGGAPPQTRTELELRSNHGRTRGGTPPPRSFHYSLKVIIDVILP